MKTFVRLLKFYKPYPVQVMVYVILAILVGFLTYANPMFSKFIIDSLWDFDSGVGDMDFIWNILWIWLFVAVFRIIIRFILGYGPRVMAQHSTELALNILNKKMLSLPIRFQQNMRAGSLAYHISTSKEGVYQFLKLFFSRFLPKLFSLIFILPIAFYFNSKLAIVAVFVIPLMILVSYFVDSKTHKVQHERDEYWRNISGILQDDFSNLMVIKSFNLAKEKQKYLYNYIEKNLGEKRKAMQAWWAAYNSFTFMMINIGNWIVTFYGIYLYTKGEVTVGDIVLFRGILDKMLNAIEGLADNFQWYLENQQKFVQMFELWDTDEEIHDIKDAKHIGKTIGNIKFHNVEFSYNKDKKVINKISFEAKENEVVALVGHTGSGKSTTMSLLMRFFDIQKGKITIDNHDISKITQESLRANIGVVFQDHYLFHDTIKNNLKVGNPKATDKQIQKACELAEAWEFIKVLPKKLNTVVGERGVKFSGGEKQRIAIARAILKDAPVLILDEATSALDTQTENKIQHAIDNLIKKRTTFIVAHRLSTIKKADKILVFKDGKIVESGTFNSLKKAGGNFAKLIDAQVAGFVE